MNQNVVEKLGAELGIPVIRTSRARYLLELAIHALKGCTFVRLLVWDPGSRRLVDVGQICLICDRETPS
jgi:hypothetical protein